MLIYFLPANIRSRTICLTCSPSMEAFLNEQITFFIYCFYCLWGILVSICPLSSSKIGNQTSFEALSQVSWEQLKASQQKHLLVFTLFTHHTGTDHNMPLQTFFIAPHYLRRCHNKPLLTWQIFSFSVFWFALSRLILLRNLPLPARWFLSLCRNTQQSSFTSQHDRISAGVTVVPHFSTSHWVFLLYNKGIHVSISRSQ